MAFCGNCGAEMQEGMRFCASCGTRWGEVGTMPVAASPAPVADSIQNTYNLRNQNIGEIRRMINYFGQKQALYDEYESLQEELEKLDPDSSAEDSLHRFRRKHGAKIVCIFLILSFPSFLLKKQVIAALLVVVAGIVVGVIAKRQEIDREVTIDNGYRRISKIASELSDYYANYGQCMVGYEFSNPRILSQIGAIIEKGRADTIKEAINRMLEDNHRSYVELQSAMAARSARQAELAADMTAIAVLCSPKSFYK